MIEKNELLKSILHECEVCKHLFTKIPQGGLDYKPSPEQRSTLELLRHLSHSALSSTQAILKNDWSDWKRHVEKSKTLSSEDFLSTMDSQMEGIRKEFESIDEKAVMVEEAVLPWGKKFTKATALMNVPLKWMVGYRMQLFLYTKAAGAHEIGTFNCWHGEDRKK